MEQTGIIRRIDKLGRIVVPKEFRKALNIEITDSVEIVLVNDRVEIKKRGCGQKPGPNIQQEVPHVFSSRKN